MSRRRTEFWLGLWTLLFIAATAVLAYVHVPGMHRGRQSESLVLRVNDQEGHLRVDWDVNNEVVRKAQGGTIEVDDGGEINRYPVEPKTLRAGGFDYIRKTPEVLLTLTLFRNGKPGALATVRSVGPVQRESVPPTVVERQVERPVKRTSRRSRSRRR